MEPLFFAMLFLFVGVIVVISLNNRFRVREIEHKETLAALEKGVDLPVRQSAPWTPRTYLLHGMIWLFAGIALFLAIFGIAVTSSRALTVEEKMHSVSIARANGATPEEIQLLLNDPHGKPPLPVGVALLGLIPVSVGLAYLIFYRVETKKLLS
jgi:hypothetical protein